jgi:bis(5'-nucleosyl)-tetraphosphatase (symmetrical)
MTRYAVGDIQGCFDSLQALLARIRFDPAVDTLWCVGDLVNRGPKSLEVLRFMRELGSAARVVLGNHDLYLLMVAAGWRKRGKDDTVQPILDAPDAVSLLDWVAAQPLMLMEGEFAMVHAGLLPQWSVVEACSLAAEVEAVLRSETRNEFLGGLAGNQPAIWSQGLAGSDRLRCIVNAMTRMRFCTADGTMEFRHKGPPDKAPPGTMPWFDVPDRRHATHTLITGHWSALGLRITPELVSLDTGCLWGGKLTAYRLDDGAIFQVDSVEARG